MSVSIGSGSPLGMRQALSRRSGRATLAAEVGAIAGLAVVATLLRLPNLLDIPRFTDETEEALIGLRLARGDAFPLTNRAPYIGALWNYLLAAAFLVGGPSIQSPRAVVLIVGVLTLVPTYLLGRSLGGPRVGVLTGALLALSPVHIAVSSHIAWSNCITPLFTTSALWLLHRAVSSDRPKGLLWSGLAFGLGLQTHPTAFLLLPGALINAAWARPSWLRMRWPYLAVGLAVLAYANVLIDNLHNHLYGLQAAGERQRDYAGDKALSAGVYGQRLSLLLRLLADSLGGVLAETGGPAGPFGDPIAFSMSLLVLAGLEWARRRREWLLLMTIASMALLLPLANDRYESAVPKARYLAPLLPLCYAALALFLLEAFALFGATRTYLASRWVLPARVAVAVVTLATIAVPPLGLQRYYREAERRQLTNAPLFGAIQAIEAARSPGGWVTVDRRLGLTYTLGGGQVVEHLTFAGAVYGWPRRIVDLPRAGATNVPPLSGVLVVDARNAPLAMQAYQLEPVAAGAEPNPVMRVFRLKDGGSGSGADPPPSRFPTATLVPAWTPTGR